MEEALASPEAVDVHGLPRIDRRLMYRYAAVGASLSEALSALEQRLARETNGSASTPTQPVFMFTGQGSQAVGMGRELLVHPWFRAELCRWCEAFSAPLNSDLMALIYGADATDTELSHTQNAQRALFALEVSLASLLIRVGIQPAAVVGHSIGELAAAHVAGVMSADDAALVVRSRAQLMGDLPSGGAMLAVRADEEAVAARVGVGAEIAALNGSTNTVLSGSEAALRAAQVKLESAGIACQKLSVSHAFHSAAMEPMLVPFREAIASVTFLSPRVPLVSNVTGDFVRDAPVHDYWIEHVRKPVRFAQCIDTLRSRGYRIFLEVGPGTVLTGLGNRSRAPSCTWLPCLRPSADAFRSLLITGAQLFELGLDLDWPMLMGRSSGRNDDDGR